MKGKLTNWVSKGSYGFVAVSFKEQYFLHRSRIIEIPEGCLAPPIGADVYFDVAPAIKPNGLPLAVNARIVAEGEKQ